MKNLKQKYIVFTRPLDESQSFNLAIEKLGLKVFSFPSIKISKTKLTFEMKGKLEKIEQYDWVLFTSRNGVRFLIEALTEIGFNSGKLIGKHIAAVGPKTADEIKKYGLPVHFMPTKYTTEDLGKEINNITHNKILLPRADIASGSLIKELKAKGAYVTNIPIYKTIFVRSKSLELKRLLTNNEILCITFTSPSTIEGFFKNIEEISNHEKIYSLPVLSIGPVTTRTLQKYRFTQIITADTYTTDGMLAKLRDSIL